MNKGLLIILLIGFSTTIIFAQDSVIIEQKEILSVLTGNSKVSDNYTLKSRYTKEERKTVKSYLSKMIKNLSLEVEEHSYNFKNPYPNKSPKYFEGSNIYTIIKATTSSDEYVILGAHFDSVQDCPGANDNATGVALVYSVAKKLAVLKKRNKNVLIIFFDQEEWGLIGSRAFSEYIKNKNLNVHSVHTIDQMGWDEDGDRAIELELPTTALKNLYAKEAKKMNIPVYTTEVNSTDHQAFRERGFKAVGITEEYENHDTTPFYHSTGDIYQTVNFEYLTSTTNLVFTVLKNLITKID
ncbi:M28 family metallopeptidase [Aquimarina sp. 2201CG5-10]|uniref:M28 family metallopeptidase n=1 Tax=Aquimarina callyspongiae TaxID=3098150 RepID=UPI002AB5CC2E|nr:M28 family peptidase [Aquimarina sp. 2201CG5-10]MDY8137028.1 M20/M25/M40 family metallo-hydrolase [Aquimarina sp. 2201CG5-10]